jgi:MFS family permease
MTAARFPWGVVLALAVAQLVAWGTLYYAFAVLMQPMGAEFGWSKPEMSGALSLGLAMTGLASYAAGRRIDRRGGRALMICGALGGAALLVAWSQITALWQLYAIWAGIGIAGATVLYDPVFAVVARAFPGSYRRAITVITLVAGFASTVFIPLTQALADAVGWRQTLLVLALIELPLCAGVPLLMLRDREAGTSHAARGERAADGVVRRAIRQPTFWLLTASYVASALLHTAILFNLVPLLAERGFTTAGAVAVYALIGPAQVLGRIVILSLERWITVAVTGFLGTILPVLALVALGIAMPESPLAYVFAAAFGAGMGIKTIVQATAAPELLGREGYGALQGAIVMPVYAAHAAAPFGAALIWQVGSGYRSVETALMVIAGLAVVTFALATAVAPKPAQARISRGLGRVPR